MAEWDFPCSALFRGAEAELNEDIILPRIDTPEDERHEVHSIVTPLPGHYEQMRIRVAHIEKQVWRLQASRKKKVSKYD